MAYIGNQQTQGFSSIPAKQDLTGATGTSLTLSHAVASAEGIDLFINNVRQEPTTAYSIGADGVTVTLTGSVVASDDIYVVYNSLALQTTVTPDASVSTAKIIDGSVTSAKLDTNISVSGTVTASGDIIRNDTTAGTSKFALQYSGSDAAEFKRNNSTGVATIANGYAGSPVDAINISLAGTVGIGTSSDTGEKHLQFTNNAVTAFVGVEGSSGNRFLGSATNNAFFGTIGADGLELATNNNVRMTINSAGDISAVGIYNNTTSGGGNVRVQSNGLLQRDTSSLRYKNTINDATHGLTELLTLRPVTYKSNTDSDTVFGGLIAEEVHDAGLTEFVSYNDDNEPDALAYGNMVSLCIKAIQEQQETITALEARITALEAS